MNRPRWKKAVPGWEEFSQRSARGPVGVGAGEDEPMGLQHVELSEQSWVAGSQLSPPQSSIQQACATQADTTASRNNPRCPTRMESSGWPQRVMEAARTHVIGLSS